jgi:uncharacterized protein YmfQ (DUF2313 family)
MTSDQYLDQLQALLPPGAAWTREKDATLTRFLQGFADELARVDLRGDQLIDEADPRTTLELLADWERVAGLPDPCVGPGLTTSQRRNALVQKIISVGGQSRAFFIAVALALGFAITIDEFLEHSVDDDVEHQLFGSDWAFTWQVNSALNTVGELTVDDTADDPLAWWSNLPLECVLGRLKPAHTFVIFAYT